MTDDAAVTGRIIHVSRPPLSEDLPPPIGELVVRKVVNVEIRDEAPTSVGTTSANATVPAGVRAGHLGS